MSASSSRSLSRVSAELHAAGACVALELGEERAQRVAAMQLVGAIGRDHEHALGPRLRPRKLRKARSSGRPSDVPSTSANGCRGRAGRAASAAPRTGAAGRASSRWRAAPRGRGRHRHGRARSAAWRAPRTRPRAPAQHGAALARERAQDAHDRGVGSSSSPSSTHSPIATRAPSSQLRRANSATMRDSPTPDSPATKARMACHPRVAQRGLELRELGHPPDQAAAGHACSHGLNMSVRPGRRGRRRHRGRGRNPLRGSFGSVGIGGGSILSRG